MTHDIQEVVDTKENKKKKKTKTYHLLSICCDLHDPTESNLIIYILPRLLLTTSKN